MLFYHLFPDNSDIREIQRQNRITQQIIQNYLERKLFPNRRPQNNAPSIEDIIQIPGLSEDTKTLLISKGGKDRGKDADNDDHDPETLQSVESEHVDNIYNADSSYRGEFIIFHFICMGFKLKQLYYSELYDSHR